MRKKRCFFKKPLATSLAVCLLLQTAYFTFAEGVNSGDEIIKLSFEDNLTDLSQNKHNVTIVGNGSSYVDGVSGKAISISNNTYINMGTSQLLCPESFTLSFWLKPDSDMGDREQIVVWNKNSWNEDGWYLSSLSADTPLELSIGSNASGQPYMVRADGSRSDFFKTDEWTHVAVAYDNNTNEVTYYRNGSVWPSSVKYALSNEADGVIRDSGVHKSIGYNGPVHNSGYANFSIDEFILYNKIINENEVANLYSSSQNPIELLNSDLDNLNIPEQVQNDIILPVQGSFGSIIEWSSDKPEVITKQGKVTATEEQIEVTLTAQASLDNNTETKIFKVIVHSSNIRLYDSGLEKVVLNDTYLINATEKDIEYLLSLESNKFLHHFYKVAGLTPPVTGYGGWEGYDGGSYWNFRGHMFGHYMSALSQAYLSNHGDNKEALLIQIKDAVNGLKECQDAYSAANPDGAGYISGFPEVDLDIVQGTGDETQRTVWVPWYNLHKVLAGLIDIYKNVQDDDIRNSALEVATSFGDYIYNRTSKLANKNRLLATEYGGMNDALYDLYNITGKIEHRQAAECFDETNLFKQLANSFDVLSGKHANTTIPKFIGALKRYTTLTQNQEYYEKLNDSEKSALTDYLTAAENFWEIVINHHTYVTGGNSQGEHFRAPDSLGEHVNSEKTCETCNTYNMLKLTLELFKLTGDKKYSDYYETTFINAILSSQNPDTGMMMYFQPMGAGFNKVFNKELEHFYCCTGTGIESFTKLNSAIYFTDGNDNIYTNMYFSSEFTGTDLKLKQEANLPNSEVVKFTVTSIDGNTISEDKKLMFRIPNWSGIPTLKINDATSQNTELNGYLVVENVKDGDIIEITFPMTVVVYDTPDKPEIVAFKYGPIVLSTPLGKEGVFTTASDGVNVRISILDENAPRTIDLPKDVKIEDWKADIANNLIRIKDNEKGQVQFKLRGTVSDFIYTPHFMQYLERYGLYMTLAETDGNENVWSLDEYLDNPLDQSPVDESVQNTQDSETPALNDLSDSNDDNIEDKKPNILFFIIPAVLITAGIAIFAKTKFANKNNKK